MSKWKTYILGDAVDKLIDYRGKTPVKVINGIPLITAKVIKNGRIETPNEFIAEDEYDNWMTRGIPEIGDVVLTTEAPLGEVAQITTKEKIALAQRVITLRGKKNVIDSTYLKYFLFSPIGQGNLKAKETGSTVTGIKQSELRQVEIYAPDFDDQIEIAAILTSLDDKIELNLQMNQTLETMAQAIFKEWFVDFKFPGFDGVLLEGLPKGWRYGLIKDIGRVVTGNTPSIRNPEFFGDKIPFITPTDFKNYGKLIIDSNRYLSIVGANSLKSRLLPKNSVIVTCIGSDMGKVALNAVECITNQQINSIVLNPKTVSSDYLYYALVFKYDYLRNIATGGSTMPIINKSKFEEIEILIPSSDVLKNFQTLLDSFNSKLEENIRQTKSLTQTRDTLLPKLMSGKIEIK